MKRKILSIALAMSVLLGVSAQVSAYSDIQSSDGYYNAVGLLSELGIIDGYEDGTFRPDKNVTRAEFIKMVVTMLKNSYSAEAQERKAEIFSDVTASHWAIDYITAAESSGIINGMGDGTFAPEENITYAQAMKILVCAAGYGQISFDRGGWPNGYMYYANLVGIGSGVSDVTNSTEITRAQVAQMINNTITVPIVKKCPYNAYGNEYDVFELSDVFEFKDGTGEDFQSILTEFYNIYTAKGYITENNQFVITASRSFPTANTENTASEIFTYEYYPEDSEQILDNINIPDEYKNIVEEPVTAFIEWDEDHNYNLIYMY